MKSPGRKKKADKQSSTEAKDQSIIELPKNLLTEKSEPEKETPPVVKEEEKTVSEPKVEIPAVEIKTETVLSQSQSDPVPPPISVPISQVETSPADEPPKRKALWVIVIFVFILLVIGGVWIYLSNASQKEEKKSETKSSSGPTPTKTQPTAVASEEAKLDKYPIKVLNGSGIAGEASQLQEILVEGGFDVSETGNAENYDYTDTVIQAKKSIEKTFLEKVNTLIGKSYSLGKTEELSASDSSDVVVIVGSKKAGD